MADIDNHKIDQLLRSVILESIEEGLVVTDNKGKITMVNAAFETLMGWKQDEVIGRDMIDVLPKIDERGQMVPREQRSLYKVISGQTKEGRVSNLIKTHCYITKSKQVLPITGVVTPIVFEGKLLGAVQVFRVVTREKESEQLKEDFVSMVSHELRTPLTAIDGLVSMMKDGEYGDYQDSFKQPLEDIATASQRLIFLVNDLLSISRMQAGRLKYTLSEFDIVQTLSEVVDILQVVAKKKGLAIAKQESQPIQVSADKDKAKQILNNLVGNAIKYTDTGSITVSFEQKDDMCTIYIEDTGVGIEHEDQKKLFGRFQQMGNQKGRPPGTGLGLFISREVAQTMGGDVWLAKSEPGRGSVFCVSVPLAGTDHAKKAQQAIKAEAEQRPDQK